MEWDVEDLEIEMETQRQTILKQFAQCVVGSRIK